MTIIFFGSDPWFSPPVLEALVKAGHKIPIIVTKGEALYDSLFAIRKSLFVQATSTEDITKKRLQNVLNQALGTRHQQPDAIILASFGPPFLDDDLLDWPRYGCLNVHASLLPRWRGPSPVFAAIAAGDQETGVTIMKMTKEIDRGPMLGQKKTEIRQPRGGHSGASFRAIESPAQKHEKRSYRSLRSLQDDTLDTRESLTRRLGELGGELIVDVLGRIGQIRPISQTHNSPTSYTRRLTKNDGRIDWQLRPGETRPEHSRRIERFIRAVTPWPGARSAARWHDARGAWNTTEIKILKAHLEWLPASRPSTMSSGPNGFPLHASLVLDMVQLPGKNPVTWKQFLAGHPEVRLG